MKRLDELTKYIPTTNYIEGEASPDMEETKYECDNDFAYLKYSEVEELVSELDDAFENCKMDLESAKATIEELQDKLEQANKNINEDKTMTKKEFEVKKEKLLNDINNELNPHDRFFLQKEYMNLADNYIRFLENELNLNG
ncbi:MAG: hypothetical protein MJZ34_07930 [Paludibacteraceae bacterium]|nr:hypothetical protein [Paludibacteraceae bacterium]